MPDDPLSTRSGDQPNPEHKLRDLFDRIEKEEASSSSPIPPNQGSQPGDRGIAAEAHPDDLGHLLSPDEIRLLQLEKDIEQARAHHREQVEEIKDEYSDRMKGLEERLQRLKDEREGKKAMELKMTNTTAEDSRGLGVGLSIAYTFIGMPLLGALVGWLLDRALKTTFLVGLCTIVGVVIGLT